MLNMWALYIFGNVAESLFGRFYFIGMYLLAGLFGSLLSSYMTIQNGHELLQHFDQSLLPHVSAGASGAVMGLGAALTVLSLFPRFRIKPTYLIKSFINGYGHQPYFWFCRNRY